MAHSLTTLAKLLFAGLFCVSSFQAYRAEKIQDDGRLDLAKEFQLLPSTARDAATFEIIHLATHGFVDKELNERSLRVTERYQKAHELLAASFASIDEEESYIVLSSCTTDLVIPRSVDNWRDDYFYERLLLEKRRQVDSAKMVGYVEELVSLAKSYEKMLPKSEVPADHQSLELQLAMAEKEIILLQNQVNSLKEHLAEVEQSTPEKWAPIIVAMISLLIALSSNIIAWRTDRRQSREAELMSLKRTELEQSIIQTSRQIKDRDATIIVPSAHELEVFRRARGEIACNARNVSSWRDTS